MSSPIKITDHAELEHPASLGHCRLEPAHALRGGSGLAHGPDAHRVGGGFALRGRLSLLLSSGSHQLRRGVLRPPGRVIRVTGAPRWMSVDAFTGQHQRLHPSDYPAGTSMLMVPFVWLAGWRGAFLLGLLALSACTLFTARWIADSGGSPLYRSGRARLSAGHGDGSHRHERPSERLSGGGRVVAVLGRRPDHSLAASGRGLSGRRVHSAFENPMPVLFAIFFAGALLRRERHVAALIVGGLAGVACRPLIAALVYGNPLFVKDHVYGFRGLYARRRT